MQQYMPHYKPVQRHYLPYAICDKCSPRSVRATAQSDMSATLNAGELNQ